MTKPTKEQLDFTEEREGESKLGLPWHLTSESGEWGNVNVVIKDKDNQVVAKLPYKNLDHAIWIISREYKNEETKRPFRARPPQKSF